MHTNQGNIVDETEISGALLSFIIEKSCNALDVLVFARLQSQLLKSVAIDIACGTDVFAIGVKHAQTYVKANVIVIPAFFDE